MKRCWCEGWREYAAEYPDGMKLAVCNKRWTHYGRIHRAQYCPWCGSKLTETKKKWAVVNAPSASVAKRLNKQMPGEDVPVNWFDILP